MIKNLTHCCEILRNYGSNRQQQQLPLSSSSHVNRFCMTSLAEIITSRQSLSQCHCTSKLGFWISGVQSFHHVRNSLQLLQSKTIILKRMPGCCQFSHPFFMLVVFFRYHTTNQVGRRWNDIPTFSYLETR